MLGLWLLIILNFLICAWDGYASGILWEKAQNDMDRLFAGSVFVMGFVGFIYTFILVGVATEYISAIFLLPTNVILGLPIILTGIVITIDGWKTAMRTRNGWSFGISIWNTFAIIHDINVWFRSVTMLGDVGGFKGLMEIAIDDDSDVKIKVFLLVLTGVFGATLIVYGLHRVGRESVHGYV